MRKQWCRQNIKKTAEECGLKRNTVLEVEQAAAFCILNPSFSDCATRPIVTILRIRDEHIRECVIRHLEGTLCRRTPTGGHWKKRITATDVTHSINKFKHLQKPIGGYCEICGDFFTKLNPPQEDHNHYTGEKRGCLCRGCNTALGSFKDDFVVLRNAITYLSKYSNFQRRRSE